MKSKLTVLFSLFGMLFLTLPMTAQFIDFPDANFKNALVNTACVDTDGNGIRDSDADTNDDGEIDVSEAEAVTFLHVAEQNIVSLEGVEYFVNIEFLEISNNAISELDISALSVLDYFRCRHNQLVSLDLSQNHALTKLVAGHNQLTSLDLSNNPAMEVLECYFNSISQIDVTQCPQLIQLRGQDNQFSQIDLSQNTSLEILTLNDNQLDQIDLSNNSVLGFLFLSNNNLSELNLSNNPLIWRLQIGGNNLSTIDVTHLENLSWFLCPNNQIYALDMSQNGELNIFNCSGNNLHYLNLKNWNNANMEWMDATNNPSLFCMIVDEPNGSHHACNPVPPAWCVDPWVEYAYDCELSIPENSLGNLAWFSPNPFTDNVSIESNQPVAEISVYNLVGQQVLTGNSMDTINTSNFENGLYIFQVDFENGISQYYQLIRE